MITDGVWIGFINKAVINIPIYNNHTLIENAPFLDIRQTDMLPSCY